jgi:hypothetical protein
MRSCLLATWICDAAGLDKPTRDTIYWVALLRYVGCTGHAHEVATVFGDEIAIRAQTLVHDAANPAEVMHDVVAFATVGHNQQEREQIIQMIQQTAHAWAVHNFKSGCEVADMLVQRLDFGAPVRDALRFTFERWNGNGFPAHAKGEAIPPPPCASSTSVRTWRPSPASSRLPERSMPPAIAAIAPTTPRWPICSSPMDLRGSSNSTRWSHGMPSSSSSRSRGTDWTAKHSTTLSPSPPTSSTSSHPSWRDIAGDALN